MTLSSYQVQRLLERLRRLGRWPGWPTARPWSGADPVRTSAAARQAAREVSDAGPGAAPDAGRGDTGPLSAEDVRESRRYAPLVEAERERRAGSFMQPPYAPAPPSEQIPKRPREAVPGPRTLGEGD